MKRYLFYIIAASALVSCADNEMTSIYKDEPDSLAQTDYLKKYGPLRDYTDMSVGTTVSPNVYDATDLNYRMLCANFNEVQPEGLFTHGSMVQADGTISTASADAFLDAAVRANQNVFAGPLTSHQGQNIDYLNNLIKPTVHSKDGSPLTSYCIVATNTIEGEAKSQQFEFAFTRTPAVTPQLEYDLVFYVRGTRSGSISLSVAGGSDFTPKVAVTTEWKKVTVHTVMRSGIYNLRSLVFNIGAYVGTLYIDNFELYEIDEYGDRSGNKMKDSSFNANLDNAEATADGLTKVDGISNGITQLGISALGDGYDPNTYTVEKTDEEKKEILTAALNNWLTGVVSACGSRVCGWKSL